MGKHHQSGAPRKADIFRSDPFQLPKAEEEQPFSKDSIATRVLIPKRIVPNLFLYNLLAFLEPIDLAQISPHLVTKGTNLKVKTSDGMRDYQVVNIQRGIMIHNYLLNRQMLSQLKALRHDDKGAVYLDSAQKEFSHTQPIILVNIRLAIANS